MKLIKLFPIVGSFAENKDLARGIRVNEINPTLQKNEQVVLDFADIESATQSFVHALISELIRTYGIEVLDKLSFKNCNDITKKIITIVVEYMQERE